MAINGVNRNPMEFMISQDKSIQDFTGSIKAGDILKGRVLDVIPGENKAVINFRGYNIVSELPNGMTINPGDVINVQVSKVNDQVFMKLMPPALNLGTGAEMPGSQPVTPQQIINLLNTIKVPVNEQNIFMAQKLLDYHLPVTAESITELSGSLARYMENKGIDVRAFNVQTPQAAKEIAVENMVKLDSLLRQANVPQQAITAAAQGTAVTTAAQGTVVTAAAQGTAATAAAQGMAVTVAAQGTAATAAALGTALYPAAGMHERINNMINTIAAVIQGSGEMEITEQNGIVTLTVKNPPPGLVKNLAVTALRDGSMTAFEADTLVNNSNLSQPASIASGSVVLNRASGNSYQIQFNNLREMIETAATPGITGQAALTQAAANMRESFNNKLLGLNPSGQNTSAVASKPDIISLLGPEIKDALLILRENTSLLQKSVTSPGSINMEQNVREIAQQIAAINRSVGLLNSAYDQTAAVKAGMSNTEAVGIKAELTAMVKMTQDTAARMNLSAVPEETNILPKDFIVFQTMAKKLSAELQAMTLPKTAPAVNEEKPLNIPIQVNPAIDMESTIESLAFLKSRNISTGNDGFIDIMGRYFKNDMKLNRNMEALNLSFEKFDAVKNTASPDRLTNAFISRLSELTAGIRQFMQGMSLNPTDNNLKLQLIQDQLTNFLDKSGMNTESRLKEAVLNSSTAGTQANETAAAASKDTLKAQLINLTNEIDQSGALNMNARQKEAVRSIHDKAADILTNMNALQFINQKPVSYEALYTQIPVFLNNKFFNGELQVWFRKGSLKENYEKSMPVNFVFMLNTSNMGNVKISMTVYKKDVECNVTIDNEKAKQVLMRGKNDFMKSMEGVNFNMKNFNIQLEKDNPADVPALSDGYVNLGRINMQA